MDKGERRREGEPEVLREGAERQIEALGENSIKSFPPYWNTLSALGQKNAKMFHFSLVSLSLLSLSPPASVSVSYCSF